MPGTRYQLEVNPEIPARLSRLDEIANNLWYSWDRPTRALFASLSSALWQATGHNPKAFLKRADQKRLEAAAENPVFLGSFNRVLSTYDTYHDLPVMSHVHARQFKEDDLIAYFCAEFGFHESLPIYSGGLGILAGDHCKAASDLGLPFIGIGLLYRQGYFHQTLDGDGRQHPTYRDSDFDDLPVTPLLDANGNDVRVLIEMPGRVVHAKVWEVKVGHVRLILLDTWLPENSEHDRDITHRLYGGDIYVAAVRAKDARIAVPEARVLANHMGQVVVVVRAEKTLQSEVEHALSTIEACPIKLLVLNQVRSQGLGAHGYGYGYGHGGYGRATEERMPAAAA